MATVEAADAASAQASAPNIAKDSGVMLLRSQQGGVASPYQTPAAPKTGSMQGNYDLPPGTNPPATGTPASTGSKSADAILASISAGNTANPNDPLATAKANILKTFTNLPAAPDQNTILNAKQAAAQALINEVNSQYVSKYSSATTGNNAREARVRSLTSNSGLGGSNVASSNAEKAAEQSANNIGMIDDEKAAKINSILSGVSQQASDEYAKQRAAYLQEIDGQWSKINEFQTSEMNLAKSNMQQLATNGVTLGMLQSKSPDTYQQLLQQSGLDPTVFAAVYNSSLPENQKQKYEYQKIGNDFYAISVDPSTNKPTATKIASPSEGSYDQFMIAPDGTPLFVDKTTGKVTEATGNYSKPKTPTGGGSTGNYPAGITTANQKNEYDTGLNFLRRQADFTAADEATYKTDAVSRAYIIKAAADEKAAASTR